MRTPTIRQVLQVIVTALILIILIIGAISLSVAEGSMQKPTASLPPTFTLQPTTSPTTQPTTQPSVTVPVVNPTPGVPTRTPSATFTLTLTPTSCLFPAGWLPYTVQNGDSLAGLASEYKKTSAELGAANCLSAATDVTPGQVIHLPPALVPTHTPIPCGASNSWVAYVVQPGDTLYRLSQSYGITVAALQKANCLTGTLIRVGQTLRVPPWNPVITYPPVSTFDTTLETPTFDLIPTDTDIIIPSDTPTQ